MPAVITVRDRNGAGWGPNREMQNFYNVDTGGIMSAVVVIVRCETFGGQAAQGVCEELLCASYAKRNLALRPQPQRRCLSPITQ